MRKGKHTLSPFKVVPLAVLCLGAQAVGASSVETEWSGQINRAVLWTDDGREQNLHHVDNETSNTRIRLVAKSAVSGDTHVGGKIEVALSNSNSASVWQNMKQDDGKTFETRHADMWLESSSWGKLSVGHGSTATDGATEVEMGGAGLVVYAGFTDMAGGTRFHTKGQPNVAVTSSDPKVGDYFAHTDGGRSSRLRYDTPEMNGFQGSVAYASNFWDAALNYGGDFGTVEFGATLGYARGQDQKHYMGSASVKHKDTGLGLTLAASKNALDENHHKGTFAGRTDDPRATYLGLNWTTSIWNCGHTNFTVGYFHGKNAVANKDKSKAWGFGVVQNLDKLSTDVYLGMHNLDLDKTGTNYDKINAVMAGFNFSF